ncbi:hypothetical protein MAR_001205 [Mya arenaria]|uniref:Apple domain-containing protein n=1 Tax=Mya arenaria TaxID=6604 RepID=A0ABY7FCN4_MYAAR|nr:hypothetical protein MAR_001205 [Mya arenaria]
MDFGSSGNNYSYVYVFKNDDDNINDNHCSAYQVAGPPDVYPTYGDVSEAWAPKEEETAEFLELLFLTPVHVTGIDIYETHLGGAVSAVKCYQNVGYTTLWTSPSIDRITVARRFRPQLATGCFSNRIKLEIAPITGWVNIDAVQLHVLGFVYFQSCHGVEDYAFDMLLGHSFAEITSSEVKKSSMLACAKSCAQNAGYGQCNMASYDKVTRLCSMKYGDSDDIVPVPDGNKIVAVITERDFTNNNYFHNNNDNNNYNNYYYNATYPCSAYQIAGAPDVYPTYGDMSEAWAPRTEKRAEFLELLFLKSVLVINMTKMRPFRAGPCLSSSAARTAAKHTSNSPSIIYYMLMFLTSVQVTGIDIYETHLGGAVSAVKCYQNGGYTTLWTSPSIERIIFARIFQPQLATGCFSNRIKLEIAAITGWVNIDAVQLHGFI